MKPFEHDYAQILKSYQTHRNELQIVALAAMERNARKEREMAEIARNAAEEERKRAEKERVAAENERKEAAAERQRAEQARTDIREEIKRQEAHRKEASRAREEVREETKNQEVHRTVVQGQLKGKIRALARCNPTTDTSISFGRPGIRFDDAVVGYPRL